VSPGTPTTATQAEQHQRSSTDVAPFSFKSVNEIYCSFGIFTSCAPLTCPVGTPYSGRADEELDGVPSRTPPDLPYRLSTDVGFRDAGHGGEDGRHVLRPVAGDGVGVAATHSEISSGADDFAMCLSSVNEA
jgi:hypothetical protein